MADGVDNLESETTHKDNALSNHHVRHTRGQAEVMVIGPESSESTKRRISLRFSDHESVVSPSDEMDAAADDDANDAHHSGRCVSAPTLTFDGRSSEESSCSVLCLENDCHRKCEHKKKRDQCEDCDTTKTIYHHFCLLKPMEMSMPSISAVSRDCVFTIVHKPHLATLFSPETKEFLQELSAAAHSSDVHTCLKLVKQTDITSVFHDITLRLYNSTRRWRKELVDGGYQGTFAGYFERYSDIARRHNPKWFGFDALICNELITTYDIVKVVVVCERDSGIQNRVLVLHPTLLDVFRYFYNKCDETTGSMRQKRQEDDEEKEEMVLKMPEYHAKRIAEMFREVARTASPPPGNDDDDDDDNSNEDSSTNDDGDNGSPKQSETLLETTD